MTYLNTVQTKLIHLCVIKNKKTLNYDVYNQSCNQIFFSLCNGIQLLILSVKVTYVKLEIK
jgi:hypothetical protein